MIAMTEKLSKKEKLQWFGNAMRFGIDKNFIFDLRSFKNGEPQWAIYEANTFFTPEKKVLNANCEWEDEVELEKRDKDFLERTRFTFDEALDIYNMYKSIFP